MKQIIKLIKYIVFLFLFVLILGFVCIAWIVAIQLFIL